MLDKALTAPGAEGDKEGDPDERIKYQGNRNLAQIGNPLLQLVVKRLVLEGAAPPGRANDILQSAFAQLEERAKSIGFFDIIKLNPRQNGVVSTQTLRLVFSAIVGAVHEDCGRVESITRDVVNRLYFDPLPNLNGYHTTSLPELEISPVSSSWEDLIDITPCSSQSQTSINTPTSENVHNGQSSKGSFVIPETTQPWTTTGSLVQEQHEFALTPSSQLDVHESEFEAVDDTFDLMDYTPQSMELYSYSFLPDNQMQTTAGGFELPTPNELDDHMIFETAIASAPNSAPAAPTDTRHPASKVATCVPRYKPKIGPVSSSRLRKRSSRKNKFEPLEEYIVLEKKRCVDAGSTFLETDFNLSVLKAHVSLPKVEPHLPALSILYYGVGSPETLATLQLLLKTRRERPVQQRRENHALSPAERAIAIERIDAKLAYCSLRKRCHVYQLYLDCSSESLKTSDTFVTNTVQTMTTRHKPQIGNPLNLEISRVLNRMLSLSYPNLYPDDPNYGQKKNYANGLRKLGQHLHLLVERFGYGILGLVPLPSNEPTSVQGLNLTDEAILRIPDYIFKHFVDCLDERLGTVLRETSKAVEDVVGAIFNEETEPTDGFAIERFAVAVLSSVTFADREPELLPQPLADLL
ncbi:hypothetical protein V492_00583 [Pseudogymnoascus sp. VKM F-4246]|nr:hypothetical protein V492_00583 [Pseudogymnoascus sp. VKM F-4246]